MFFTSKSLAEKEGECTRRQASCLHGFKGCLHVREKLLKHELVDYLITSRIIKPLVNLLNILIKAREAEIYKEKEKLVEIFSKII